MARMLPDGRRLGAHLALGDGMVKAAERAAKIGADALQVFSDNPTAWRRRPSASAEIPAFRAQLAASGIAPLAIHASYLINLAGSDPDYHERSVRLVAAELRSARRFGATIVNVHVGSHGGIGVEAGIERLVTTVRRALDAEDGLPEDGPLEDGPPDSEPAGTEDADRAAPADRADSRGADSGPGPETTIGVDHLFPASAPATIALENSAGGGFGLGTSLDELTAIADALDAASVPASRIGFCLDTAHAWGAGIDLSNPAEIDAFLDDFDRRIGLGRLPLIHLNDSRAELGSRTDRHEHVGAGRIGEVGMAHLLRHPLLSGATYILETPGMDEGYDAINLDRARALARGETPAPLPPGAFTLRGSRARAATPVDPPVDPPLDPSVDPSVDPPVDPPVDPSVDPPVDAPTATRAEPLGGPPVNSDPLLERRTAT
jgi:deoxyribonuclease-4